MDLQPIFKWFGLFQMPDIYLCYWILVRLKKSFASAQKVRRRKSVWRGKYTKVPSNFSLRNIQSCKRVRMDFIYLKGYNKNVDWRDRWGGFLGDMLMWVWHWWGGALQERHVHRKFLCGSLSVGWQHFSESLIIIMDTGKRTWQENTLNT